MSLPLARCLAFRDGDTVRLQSKAGKPLGRYFPDVVESLGSLDAKRFVLDGEIVIPVNGRLSFDELRKPPGFTGRAPGGPSRWSTERSAQWEPLAPKLVVEVGYDHVSGGRFRHGTRFVRWRPDKAPEQCRMEQLT
jgi:ATP-dependent DNA ligase